MSRKTGFLSELEGAFSLLHRLRNAVPELADVPADQLVASVRQDPRSLAPVLAATMERVLRAIEDAPQPLTVDSIASLAEVSPEEVAYILSMLDRRRLVSKSADGRTITLRVQDRSVPALVSIDEALIARRLTPGDRFHREVLRRCLNAPDREFRFPELLPDGEKSNHKTREKVRRQVANGLLEERVGEDGLPRLRASPWAIEHVSPDQSRRTVCRRTN